MDETIEKPKVVIPQTELTPQITDTGLTPQEQGDVQTAAQSLVPQDDFKVEDFKSTIPSSTLEAPTRTKKQVLSDVERSNLASQASAQQESDQFLTDIKSTFQTLGGRSQALAAEEAKFDIEGQTKELTGAQTQLTSLTQTFDEAVRNLEGQGRGIGQTILGRQERQLLKEKAIAVGAQAAIVQTMQGNIELGRQTAQRTIDLEFQDVEQQLQQQMFLLDRSDAKLAEATGKVSADEQARNEQLRAEIEAEQVRIEDAKETKSQIFELATKARIAGADDATVQAMLQAESPENALLLAGNSLTPQEKEKTTDDIQEYQFAKETGFVGSFLDFQRANANLKFQAATKADKLLSPSEAQRLGVPYGTTQTEAANMGITPQKDPTQGQRDVAGYAIRLDQSTPTIDKFTDLVSTYNPTGYKAAQVAAGSGAIGNPLIPDDLQSVFQAQRNFVNSVLRRESGAVISQEEFDNAALQYFPLPGDGEEVLENKRQNREAVRTTFQVAGGAAYDELNLAVTPEVTNLEEYITSNPQELDAIERMIQDNPEFTDEEILQIING